MAQDGFKVADAYVELTLDKDRLNTELDGALADLPRRSGPEADRSGKGLGDKVSQGMRMAVIRNSPLIVAAIGAGLAAGGPLLATAATGLFAVVGIVAAAQAEKVQQSWLGAWHQIRDGAIADSAAIVPVLTMLASTVTSRFEGMRPILRNIFADAAPQIAVFADGILRLTENALPGFQRVIGDGMTVTRGFADFLAKVGTGLGDLFSRLADYAPTVGLAWSQLGDAFAELLPLLGEVLGQGSELATIVLPALSGSLGVLLDVVTALGPALPFLLTGFGSWKLLQTAGGWVEKLGGQLSKLGSKDIPGVSSVAGKLGSALTGIGTAAAAGGVVVGALAATLALLMIAHQQSQERIRSWTEALIEGGQAAKTARAEMAEHDATVEKLTTGWRGWVAAMTPAGVALHEMKGETDAASQAAKDYLANLDPLERAQHLVEVAQKALNEAVDKHGPTSRQAADAAAYLSDRQAEVARVAEEEERAIRGVTQAMIDQIDQARALVDKQFAMEDALKSVAELTEAYTTAVREHGASSKEAADALDDLERGYRKAGAAAADMASSGLPAEVDDQTRALFGARAELAYYRDLLAQGIDLPPELDTYVALLERQAGGALSAAAAQDILGAAIRELGVAVEEVPGEKAVLIKGEGTEELRAKLSELGFQIVEMPDGEFKVIADTPEAEAQLANLMANLATVDATTAKPGVELGGVDQFNTDIASMEAWLLNLDGARANPDANLDSAIGPQTQTDLDWLGWLDQQLAGPQAELNTTVGPQTQTDIGLLGILGGQVATPQAFLDDSGLQGTHAADLGLLGNLAGQTPTPTAGINDAPLISTWQSDIGWLTALAGQRPTPVANLNNNPFAGAYAWAIGQIGTLNAQRPSPVATLYASTSAAEAALNHAARNRSSTIFASVKVSGSATVGATGGRVDQLATIGFDGGGKVRGPGGPTEDRVAAFGPDGYPNYRLSATEWIIKAISAGRYGDRRMAAVNDGTATILLPGEEMQAPIRAAVGGPLSRFGDRLDGIRDRMADVRDRAQAAVDQATIRVDNLTVKIETPLNLMSPADLRKAAQILRAAIIGLDRETS